MENYELAENELRERLALNVRRLRRSAGMSARAVAERAGIPLRQVQRLEAAQLNVTIRTLARVAYALKADVLALLAK